MDSLFERIDECPDLPTIPAVALEIVSLCQKPDTDVDQLSSLIALDPAMVARVLKTANSCLFANAPRATSARRAVVRLGLKMTRMTVLSFALVSSTIESHPESFDFENFWKHALAGANGAAVLCAEMRLQQRDEAFAAGILQDVGVLALHYTFPQQYASIITEKRKDPERDLSELERSAFGGDHAVVSAYLLEKWGLPREVIMPVRHHHAPELLEDENERRLARILHIGADIGHLFVNEGKGHRLMRVFELGKEYFELPRGSMERMLATVSSNMRDLSDLFSVDPGAVPSYTDLRQKVVFELAQIASVSTDLPEPQTDPPETAAPATQATPDQEVPGDGRDELTGLLDRPAAETALQRELERSVADNTALAILILDIDGFKKINEKVGRQAGDSILKLIASCLGHQIDGEGFAARRDDDAFLLVLPVENQDDGRTDSERIRREIQSQSSDWLFGDGEMTVSVGALFVSAGANITQIAPVIQAAEECLAAARDAGGNCTRYAAI